MVRIERPFVSGGWQYLTSEWVLSEQSGRFAIAIMPNTQCTYVRRCTCSIKWSLVGVRHALHVTRQVHKGISTGTYVSHKLTLTSNDHALTWIERSSVSGGWQEQDYFAQVYDSKQEDGLLHHRTVDQSIPCDLNIHTYDAWCNIISQLAHCTHT